MQRRFSKPVVGSVGVAVLALAVPIVGAGSAQAGEDTKSKCGPAAIEWSADDGKTWSRAGLLGALHTKLSVRIANDVDKSCAYKVTLAAYSTEGPTWKTSGVQRYLGSQTTTLSGKGKVARLDIAKHAPPCFGQIDLYGNDKVFDGKSHDGKINPLPRYPDAKFPVDMIAGWNGGKECAPPTTKPPTTKPPTTAPPTTKPPTTTPPSTTASPTTAPPTTKPPTTAPPTTTAPSTTAPPTTIPPTTTPPTTEPPPEETTAAPEEQRPPVTNPNVPGELAETGAGNNVGLVAAASVTALLAGAGTLVLVGRRPRERGQHNPWLDAR